MAQIFFGKLIAERRKRKNLTQEEVAAVLGMTRANYSQLETGRRKDVLDPERAQKLARLLAVDMVELLNAMGYPVSVPGLQNETELRLLESFRKAAPSVQQMILRGLEVET